MRRQDLLPSPEQDPVCELKTLHLLHATLTYEQAPRSLEVAS
jgi:hypothetical protein